MQTETLDSFRDTVLRRDGFRCVVGYLFGVEHECHPTLDAHHIIPRDEGGTDDPDNGITVCHRHHPTAEAIRRRLTAELPPCHHRHRYAHARQECDERRRRELVART